jgi:membrane fusion protein, multidrug efflux system
VNEGKIKLPTKGMRVPVFMGLQGEDGFPHQGAINFFNNQVNPTTGSILVRGVFPNPSPKVGHRLLSPRTFVRVRLPIGQPYPALLVIDRAVGSDQQGLKYVYVLDKENKARSRHVTTGPLQDDGLRVIEQGLKPDELVVVGALQQVRAEDEVRPEKVPMPSFGQPNAIDVEASPDELKKASSSSESKQATPSPGESKKATPSPSEPTKH